jgi:hypothetical protein
LREVQTCILKGNVKTVFVRLNNARAAKAVFYQLR